MVGHEIAWHPEGGPIERGFRMPKKLCPKSLLAIVLATSAAAVANADRAQQQAALDAACEEAREQRLKPERERFVEECVTRKQKPDRASCERFYSDYGARSVNRTPLYYDLPECVDAFEFRKSQ
jgi:hypothetical protein